MSSFADQLMAAKLEKQEREERERLELQAAHIAEARAAALGPTESDLAIPEGDDGAATGEVDPDVAYALRLQAALDAGLEDLPEPPPATIPGEPTPTEPVEADAAAEAGGDDAAATGAAQQQYDDDLALARALQEEEEAAAQSAGPLHAPPPGSAAAARALQSGQHGKVRLVASRPAADVPAGMKFGFKDPLAPDGGAEGTSGRRVYAAEDWERALADEAADRRRELARVLVRSGYVEAATDAEAMAKADSTARKLIADARSGDPKAVIRLLESQGKTADAERLRDELDYHLAKGTSAKHDEHIQGRHNVHELERRYWHLTGDLAEVRGASGGKLRLRSSVTQGLRRAFDKKTVKGQSRSGRVEKSQHATREGVLDDRTRLVLFKLVNAGALAGVHGVIKTGKEAAVFHASGWEDAPGVWSTGDGAAVGPGAVSVAAPGDRPSVSGGSSTTGESLDGDDERQIAAMLASPGADAMASAVPPELPATRALARRAGAGDSGLGGAAAAGGGAAEEDSERVRRLSGAAGDGAEDDGPEWHGEVAIKIYRTSLSEFSNRGAYLDGQQRLRRSRLNRHNTHKFIREWAKMEFRNLVRFYCAGLPCPRPRMLRQHVLVMDFVGEAGEACPQLKTAVLPSQRDWRRCYAQVVSIMHGMYNCCRMVHADLSEYNLLWDERGHGRAWVIDVGQAVETNHPKADEYLAKDAHNVTSFFEKKGVRCLPEAELLAIVTDGDLGSVFRSRGEQLAFRREAAGVAAWDVDGGGDGDGEEYPVDEDGEGLQGPEEDDDEEESAVEAGGSNDGIAQSVGGPDDPVTARLREALAAHIALEREDEEARRREDAAAFAAELEREDEEAAAEEADAGEEDGAAAAIAAPAPARERRVVPGTRVAEPAEPRGPASGAGVGGPVSAEEQEMSAGSAARAPATAVLAPAAKPAGAWGARASAGGLAGVLASRREVPRADGATGAAAEEQG